MRRSHSGWAGSAAGRRALTAAAIAAALPWLTALALAHRDDPAKWSTAEWTRWRDAEIATILTPTYSHDGERLLLRTDVADRCASAYAFIAPRLADPAFLADKQRAAALGNILKFTEAQHWVALKRPDGTQTHALGMDISDAEYWEFAKPYTTLPALLRSPSFLACMSHRGSYKYAADMIDARNRDVPEDQRWIVLPFRGQFVASVDRTTFGRLLVVAPNQPMPDGETLDQWISFAIARPEMDPEPTIQSVSVVAVLRDPAQPGRSKAFFTDYFREYDAASDSIVPRPTFLMHRNPSQNCYDCHKSAVIPIRPKATYRFDSDGSLVEGSRRSDLLDRLDGLIGTYGQSDLGHLSTDAYGPSLGSPSRKPEVARPPFGGSLAKVRENMTCGKCHEAFGKLNYLLGVRSDSDVKSFEAKQGLVQSFIEQGFMPPGNTLTATERHTLWESVSRAYFDPATGTGAFVDWLKGER